MSIYKEQKAVKPKPEDVARNYLNIERTADMSTFVEFVRANKLGVRWVSGNSWALNYKGKQLGFLKIYTGILGKPAPADLDGTWYFCHRRTYLDRYYSMEDCDLKKFVFEHIYARNCGNCICTNPNPNEIKAGYMNSTGCGCWPLRIYNPTGEALELTKRLIECRMNYILEENTV